MLEPHRVWDSSLFTNVNEVSSHGLNVWGIRNLWSEQPSPEPFRLSIPVHKNDLPEEADLSRELFKAFDVLHFDASGMRVPYLRIPVKINIVHQRESERQGMNFSLSSSLTRLHHLLSKLPHSTFLTSRLPLQLSASFLFQSFSPTTDSSKMSQFKCRSKPASKPCCFQHLPQPRFCTTTNLLRRASSLSTF